MTRHPFGPSADELIITITSRQHGVVSRAQLLQAGLTADMVDGRVRSRRLRLIHRGIYINGALVGPLVPPRSREMAAVLACGRGAAVSHESAAALWGLLPPERTGSPVHVTVAGGDRGRRAGVRPHRVTSLGPDEITVVTGVPVTSPARTIVDVAAGIRPRELEQAMAVAERRGLAGADQIARALERRGPVTGAAALRPLLEAAQRPALSRSMAEERFLTLIRSGRLPPPEANAAVGNWELDFLWRAESVAVDVDGFAYHSSRQSFEGDRRRDADLAARGIHVVRVTWRQIIDEPEAVLVRLAQTLARAHTRWAQRPPRRKTAR